MREGIGRLAHPRRCLELQRILTEGTSITQTLRSPTTAGRGSRRGVRREGGDVLHERAAAVQLQSGCSSCATSKQENARRLATRSSSADPALLDWLRPPVRGRANGRTARALFYWSMRNRAIARRVPLDFAHPQRGPGPIRAGVRLFRRPRPDATYFHPLSARRGRAGDKAAPRHLRRKVARGPRRSKTLLRGDTGGQHRQLALLGHALRTSDTTYTFGTPARSHGVTHETARKRPRRAESRGLSSAAR